MNINDAFPSNYIKSADIDNLPTKEMTLTLSTVSIENVGTQDNPEQKPVVHFHGAQKGMVLNKTNAMALEAAYGPETNMWVGQSVTLFTQPVMFQGQQVRGLRLKPNYQQAPVPGAPAMPAYQPTPQPGSALASDPRPTPPDDDEIPF